MLCLPLCEGGSEEGKGWGGGGGEINKVILSPKGDEAPRVESEFQHPVFLLWIPHSLALCCRNPSRDSRVVEVFGLYESFGMVCKCDDCRNVYVVEDVINRKVVVLKVTPSQLRTGRTLAEKVGDGFLFFSAGWAFACVAFPHVVEMFVQSAVTRNKLYCRPVLASLVLEGCVEVVDDLGVLAAKKHLSVFRAVESPVIVVQPGDFLVNQSLDVGLWYRAL